MHTGSPLQQPLDQVLLPTGGSHVEGCPPAVVTGIEISIIAFQALQLLLVTKIYN
jgi:hypothetical protein